ncbi:eukaryotic rRNA processing [Flagelloscypha sp. PMI_526]|nr:eukaryotic rRNA processing [Flagelloscypha sp. PMI_526]
MPSTIPTKAKSKLPSKSSPVHKSKPKKLSSPPADSSSEESDAEDDDIDSEGYKRLITALGDDGLDEYDQAQLNMLLGDEQGGDGSEDSESESESDQEKSNATRANGTSHTSIQDENEDEDVDEDLEDEDLEEDIPLDSLEHGVLDEDFVPRQKVEIDNHAALARIRETISLDESIPWTETLSVTYPKTIDVDVDDDLVRELAFYNQALHSAQAARKLASSSKPPLPWSRPPDYFAEMVKSDAHMERIRQKLLDEKAGIKRSEDAKKMRDGKKFGKKVQLEKLKEREQSKKDMEERLKGIKRKRKDMPDGDAGGEDFDVAIEDALEDKGRPTKKAKMPRTARDKKFGFGGGAGRRSKQNTKSSTDDFNPRAAGGGRGAKGGARGAKRLGKGRRQAVRGRR